MATFMGERVRDRMYPITCGVEAGCEKNYGGGKKGVSPKTKTEKSPRNPLLSFHDMGIVLFVLPTKF